MIKTGSNWGFFLLAHLSINWIDHREFLKLFNWNFDVFYILSLITIILSLFQTASNFEETIKENTKSANHWKRERVRIKLEDIPDGEKEELKILDVEELKTYDHAELDEEIAALKAGIANSRPDLVTILLFDSFDR